MHSVRSYLTPIIKGKRGVIFEELNEIQCYKLGQIKTRQFYQIDQISHFLLLATRLLGSVGAEGKTEKEGIFLKIF